MKCACSQRLSHQTIVTERGGKRRLGGKAGDDASAHRIPDEQPSAEAFLSETATTSVSRLYRAVILDSSGEIIQAVIGG